MRVLRNRTTASLLSAVVAAPVLFAAASPAGAQDAARPDGHRTAPADKAQRLAAKLVKKSTGKSAYRHLEKLQQIADAHGGNRAAGTPGHQASTRYVYDRLKKAGYKVTYQNFTLYKSRTLRESASVLSPEPRKLNARAFAFSKSTPQGGLQAPVAAARVDTTPGCEADDYTSDTFTGKIALVKRGACTFAEKEAAATKAGAVGIVVYNHSGDQPVEGDLEHPRNAHIPAVGITKAEGEKLAGQVAGGEVRLSLDVATKTDSHKTRNVIAETRGGRADRVVALGAHLDSVPEGPGINDNGSGSAGLIEVAEKLAKETKGGKKLAHKVRFGWWSAEEVGLLGSDHYVKSLSAQQKKNIKLYLNFDMIASPNAAEFVYDGDDSDKTGAGAGPAGSAQIEKLINGFLDKKKVPHWGTDFDGRSDYGPFIDAGIPAGGTFTGAEGLKTAEQAAKAGGEAGRPYDPNYHAKGDDITNINRKAFDLNIDAIANAVGTYAQDLSSLRH
ncbi:M28 family metallopeptidase [Streptomyces alboniger]|uniref:M28 family peptidase n=2 Tax=Streptomyces alboniger TaxID=132473 RepID=A0A5J6HSM9_STRAD|nr:M28 family metallopeptidase [Streptomyces alboniger]QEV21844.1 M28 family peptidase [Streptomyces alboniger]